MAAGFGVRLSVVAGLRDSRDALPLLTAAQGWEEDVPAKMQDIALGVHFAAVGVTGFGIVHTAVKRFVRPLRLETKTDLKTAERLVPLGLIRIVRIEVGRVGAQCHDAHAHLGSTGEYAEDGTAGFLPVAADISILRVERRGQQKKQCKGSKADHASMLAAPGNGVYFGQ